MSTSIVSNLDIDLEKAGIPVPIPRSESPNIPGDRLSRRMSRTRTHSRNFSRPSPPSSLGSIQFVDSIAERRRSSGDEPDRARNRRAISPLELPASPVRGRLPSFAQKAMDPSIMLHHPPPVPHSSSPPPSRSSRASRSRSVDVVEAARFSGVKHLHPYESTNSLLATIREKAKQEPSTFAQRVFETGKDDLLYDVRTSKRMKERVQGVLDLTTLQRMSQQVLRQKLVEQVKAIGDRGAWMEIGIRETLHEYCELIRDLEYMENSALQGEQRDPFRLTTNDPIDCKLLEDVGLAWGDPKKKLPQLGPDKLGASKRVPASRRRLRRLLMALLGGLALIGPFLIMLLITGQMVRLVATCAFTVVFAVVVAFGSDLDPDRIGLMTAAYAAALIVFVGTDPPSYQYR